MYLTSFQLVMLLQPTKVRQNRLNWFNAYIVHYQMIIIAKESIIFLSVFAKTHCFAKAVNELLSQAFSLFLSSYQKGNCIHQISVYEIT